MKRLILFCILALLCSCSTDDKTAGGPGSETTNGIVALIDGVPTANANVALRKVDYKVHEIELEDDLILPDFETDENGRFVLENIPQQTLRLTVLHEDFVFSKVITEDEISAIDSVVLLPAASIEGTVEIPEEHAQLYVGVFGTDILVATDENGNFELGNLPSNDSISLYFVQENLEEVYVVQTLKLQAKEVKKLTPLQLKRDTIEVIEPEGVQVLFENKAVENAKIALSLNNKKASTVAENPRLFEGQIFTDERGYFSLDSLAEIVDTVMYRLTVSNEKNGFTAHLLGREIRELQTIELEPVIDFSSYVTLKAGEKFAYVGIYGFDILVKTDTSGNFTIKELPVTDSLYFYVVLSSDTSTANVAAKQNIFIGDYINGAHTPQITFQDFEYFGIANTLEPWDWYISVDSLGSTRTPASVVEGVVYDSLKQSKVFKGSYTLANSPNAYVVIGSNVRGSVYNFSKLDSISFYAKGNGEVRLSLENWNAISGAEGTNLKASSAYVKLSETWTRYTFTPDALCFNAAEQKNCETTFEKVKNTVSQIALFPRGGTEIAIDDIIIYGAWF